MLKRILAYNKIYCPLIKEDVIYEASMADLGDIVQSIKVKLEEIDPELMVEVISADLYKIYFESKLLLSLEDISASETDDGLSGVVLITDYKTHKETFSIHDVEAIEDYVLQSIQEMI